MLEMKSCKRFTGNGRGTIRRGRSTVHRFVIPFAVLLCLILAGCSPFWNGWNGGTAPPLPSDPPVSSEPPFDPDQDTDQLPHPQDPPEDSQGLSEQEQLLLQLVNEARNVARVPPLAVHPELSDLARLKAQDMVQLGYFSHDSPTYGSPQEMIQAAGIDYRFIGENIAKAGSVQQAFAALMQSEGHRKNILSAGYTHIGLGVIEYGNPGSVRKSVMVVQLFLTPRTRN